MFAIEENSGIMPVYLKLNDPSGKFEIKLNNSQCAANANYNKIPEYVFIGCTGNAETLSTSTTFKIYFGLLDVAQGGVAAKTGFTFPYKSMPETLMNKWCGKNIATNAYDINLKINKVEKDSATQAPYWLMDLRIVEKKK